MKVYTDGSCLKNKVGGWAFIIIDRENDDEIISYDSQKNTTNNRMELIAVIESLKYIKKYYKRPYSISLYTDSMLTLNCGQNIWKRKKNVDLWSEFDLYSRYVIIEWIWVKAHNGNYYNEIVDSCARQAAITLYNNELDNDNITTTDDYVFFYNGVFSQWHICPFFEEGVKYNCAEQYMMAKKALLFDDFNSYKKIMDAKSPFIQKKLGRSVKNFNENIWKVNRMEIVTNGNYLKFYQNRYLLDLIKKTGDRTMVECSPYDKIWGIGLALENPDIYNRSMWKGSNLLGKAIMNAKKILRL